MLDATGLPLAGHTVTVETLRTALPLVHGLDTFYVGESLSRRYYELNADGVLSLKLVKGSNVLITIEGGFTRDIIVPNEDFDVLSYAGDDGFINPARPVELAIKRV